MKLKKYFKLNLAILSLSLLFFNIKKAAASSYLWRGVRNTCQPTTTGLTAGKCSPCDLVQIAVNAGAFILGVVGSFTLLMFVYGGIMWLTSGGRQDRIDKGKQIITAAVIGFTIVMFAWFIVVVIIQIATGQTWTLESISGKLGC